MLTICSTIGSMERRFGCPVDATNVGSTKVSLLHDIFLIMDPVISCKSVSREQADSLANSARRSSAFGIKLWVGTIYSEFVCR